MRKKTPDTSKLTRAKAAPYTLRTPDASDKNLVVAKDKTDKGEKATEKVDPKTLVASDGKIDAKFDDVKSGEVPASAEPARVEPHDGAPKLGDGPKSATHNELPTQPAPEPVRARAETLAMPVVGQVGAPPAMPGAGAESPTHMPGPKDIPTGNPSDAASPPGNVPPGDSRSLRKGDEFALVYRQGTAVISRFGTVGQRGQWRVVEYPTSSSASNAYAKECSRFVGEGFSDYRE
jgi:hypothetical protein